MNEALGPRWLERRSTLNSSTNNNETKRYTEFLYHRLLFPLRLKRLNDFSPGSNHVSYFSWGNNDLLTLRSVYRVHEEVPLLQYEMIKFYPTSEVCTSG